MIVTEDSLASIRIFDLRRVLAGPTASQLLGDFGADITKVERARARRRHDVRSVDMAELAWLRSRGTV